MKFNGIWRNVVFYKTTSEFYNVASNRTHIAFVDGKLKTNNSIKLKQRFKQKYWVLHTESKNFPISGKHSLFVSNIFCETPVTATTKVFFISIQLRMRHHVGWQGNRSPCTVSISNALISEKWRWVPPRLLPPSWNSSTILYVMVGPWWLLNFRN